jgi:hypothetical protein
MKGLEDVVVSVNYSDPNISKNVMEKCAIFLTTSFMNSLPDQVDSFFAHEHYQDYTLTLSSNKEVPIHYHNINPSLFELTASKIAHYLFPENFAEYKFVIKPNMNVNEEIDAGYLSTEDIECTAGYLEGIENIYATAFYLGLEVRSHQCRIPGNKSYLFVNDFSHPFHKVDVEQTELIEEYRDHKILPSEKGTLFPSSFLNKECGKWIGKDCDIGKLKDAYKKIIEIPQDEINKIIDTAIHVLQSIECKDNQDNSCRSDNHYNYMNHDVKAILLGNHESIKSSLTDV